MNQYYIYRLERSLSAAEQRAADQHSGELAAALAGPEGPWRTTCAIGSAP